MKKEEKRNKTSFRDRIDAFKLSVKWAYRSSKSLSILTFFISIIGGLLVVVEPYIFKVILDGIVGDGNFSIFGKIGIGLWGVIIAYGLLKIIQSTIWDVQSIIKRLHSHKLDKYSTTCLMDKVSSLDLVYFESPEYYNILSKSNQSFYKIGDFFWRFTFSLSSFVSAIVIIASLATFNWLVVALMLFASVPSLIFVSRVSAIKWNVFDYSLPIGRYASYYKNLMTQRANVVKELKLFNLRSYFLKKYDVIFSKYVNEQKKAAKKESTIFVIIGISESLFTILTALIIISAFIKGSVTVGEFTFYWAILFRFSDTARDLVRTMGQVNEDLTFITPIVKILGFKPTIKEIENPIKFPEKLKNGIEFRNVTFYYPRSSTPAIKNFNVFIKPNESVAIVGENGSGKTTLIKLLTRLYDVSSGEILIDGENIKNYSIKSIYKNIGIIFQNFVRYEGEVGENIYFGDIKAKNKKTKSHKAAIKSGAWEFIKKLKSKYKTHLGKTLVDKGTELSVGQWQKIALSRAFFKDAQILCLDEPTSAVDAKTEYELFKKFEKLTDGKLTILISHRFSTVRMADRILVVDEGKLVEEGSHRELLSKKGRYEKLFSMQAEGYRDYHNLKK